MSIFGPIVAAEQVEAAVESTLRRWMVTYLAEFERQSGRDPGDLPPPQSYQVLADLEHMAEQGPPMVVIVSTGIAGPPTRHERGFSAVWTINTVAVVTASSQDLARRLAGAYAAVIRAIAVQNGTLGGFAVSTDWLDEDYILRDTDDRRIIAAARVELGVEVAVALEVLGGPLAPHPVDEAESHDDWPSVITTGVEVDLVPASTEEA